MKRLINGFLIALALFVAPMQAAIDTVDAVPAATLLLPYFEVDLVNENGLNTIFTVANSRANPALAHVTLWTDRGVPTYSFDIYLGGYDVEEVDLRLLFNGLVPQTSPTITPAGANSGAPVAFPGCAALLAQGRIPAATVTQLRNAHTGLASTLTGGVCGSTPEGDNKARGYVTIDSTSSCTVGNPTTPGYFVSGGTGIANNDNILWGDYSLQDRTNLFAYADNLAHIEASASDTVTDGAGDYTFYARRVANTGADNREALPTQWMARYEKGGPGSLNTTAFIWRDPGAAAPFACGNPTAIPVSEIVAWDDRENPSGVSDNGVVSRATQSVDLSSDVVIPFDKGMIAWGLGTDFSTLNQAYVSHIFKNPANWAGQVTAWPLVPSSGVGGNAIFYGPSPIGNGGPSCSNGIDDDSDGFTDFPADTGCRSPDQIFENPRCSNGFDDDGDTLVDMLDPDCKSPSDHTEFPGPEPQCDDGIDNDSDGQTDYPADPGCSDFQASADFSESEGICNNGLDDDGDNLIDFPSDPGCQARNSSTENPQCMDTVDNDGDGDIDSANDAGCGSDPFSNNEGPACDNGVSDDADGLIDFPADPGCESATSFTEAPQCNNGSDSDGDGLIDMNDPGCSAPFDNSEFTPQCSDGYDNDSDGQIDFPNDNGCTSGDDFEGPDCNDTIDNDLDGLIDFPNDPGCASAADNNEFAGTTTRECSDGVDNDGDALVDRPADSGCTSAYDDNEYNP